MGAGRQWTRRGFDVLFLNGKEAETNYSLDTTAEPIGTVWDLERTSLELQERGPRLAAILASTRLPAHLAEAIRCAAEAKGAQSRSQIILYDRVVEMVSAHARLEARDLADWLAAGWAEDRLWSNLRNAVNPATEPAIASVYGFAGYLASGALQVALDSFVSGYDLSRSLADSSTRRQERRDQLKLGHSLLELLND